VVTADGPQVLTRFPADELLIAGRAYVRGADFPTAHGNGRATEASSTAH
jgi:hypothetical protein